MPAQSRRQTETTGTESSVAPAVSTEVSDNAFTGEQLQLQNAKQSYEQALGSFLGGELFKVVSKELSEEKLDEHARGAVDDAFKAVKEWLVGQAEPSEAAIASQFSDALEKALEPRIEQLLADSNISAAISSWAVDHPRSVLAAALAGAAAYVLSNQDIPDIEHKMGMGGGHAILAGVNLGSTLDIALNTVKLGYAYKGESTTASLDAEYGMQDESLAVTGNLSHQTDAGMFSLDGAYNQMPGSMSAELGAAFQNDDLSARLFGRTQSEGGQTLNTLGADVRGKYGENGNYYMGGEYRSDESWMARAGLSVGDANENGAWSLEGRAMNEGNGKSNVGAFLGYKLNF
ncbi:MAG: hypothetical protein ACI9VR_004187 [Cognaticolwellia sp.]|jgi:hypothetical protein